MQKEKLQAFFEEYSLTPRPQQDDVLTKLADNWEKYDYFVLSLPTGVGKTYISTAIANAMGDDKAYILTSTLQLQTQYESSWPKLVNIKGRSNYQCGINAEFTVDHAPCTVKQDLIKSCTAAKICPYYNARNAAVTAQSMITNPLYFLYSTHCGFLSEQHEGVHVQREALIVDEAHNLEGHIIQFSESKLSFTELYDKHGVDCKGLFVKDDETHNIEILRRLSSAIEERIDDLKSKMKKEYPFADKNVELADWAKGITKKAAEKARKWQSQINYLDKVLQPLKIYFTTAHEEEMDLGSLHDDSEGLEKPIGSKKWLIHPDVKENTLTLTPLKASFLFHFYLGKVAKKYIFLSATTGDFETFCKELGIDRSRAMFIETDTPFPPEKSPVVVFPLLKMGYKDIDNTIPQLVKCVGELMQQHPKEKGIIHCGTYKIQNEILKRISSSHKSRLIARDMSDVKLKNEQLLALHKLDDKPTVLLSPSMMEGVDLYDDLSRFQIILKFPWASLGDPRVAAKSKLDPNWYSNKTWMHIMQASGRSTRHEEDESTTYIMDASFPYFYKLWQNRLPKWFKDRVVFT